jgi:hypothetical protein
METRSSELAGGRERSKLELVSGESSPCLPSVGVCFILAPVFPRRGPYTLAR